jgi:replicative DNA helicase
MPDRYTLASAFVDPVLERSMLAAIAARPDEAAAMVTRLTPELFPEAQALYEAVMAGMTGEQPMPTIDDAPATDLAAAVQALENLYGRRLVADLIQDAAQELPRAPSATDLVARLDGQLTRLRERIEAPTAAQAQPLTALIPQVLQEVTARRQAIQEGRTTVGVPTSLLSLDRLLGGFQPGVHALGAEPGQGKTTLALQVAITNAAAGIPVLLVNFEESLIRLTLKALCAKAGKEAKRFLDGFGNPADLESVAREYEASLAPLHLLQGNSRLTPVQVKAAALQLMRQFQQSCCLIIVDYLQSWAATRQNDKDFRLVVSSLMGELRAVALELDSPVLVICSQNRQGQGSSKLTSLKESGDLEYAADTVMFLVANEKRSPVSPARTVDLMVKKNRFGDQGEIPLTFFPALGKFLEADG